MLGIFILNKRVFFLNLLSVRIKCHMKHQTVSLCCLHRKNYHVLLWKAITKNDPLTHQYTFHELYVTDIENMMCEW